MPALPSYALPLTRGQEARRLVVASVLGVVAWFGQFTDDGDPGTWPPLADLALGVVALVLLHQRRRWPFAVALVTVASTALSGMALPAAFIALISLTTTRRWSRVAAVVAVGVVAVVGAELIQPDRPDDLPWWTLPLTAIVLWGVGVLIGLYVATRRALAWSLRERAEREQRDRDELARRDERARIAREMHDVLAHRISLLALHAGAMAYRDDLSGDQLRAAARLLDDNARLAMDDLRSVLGVLRDPTAARPEPDNPEPIKPERPQPTLADLPELVAETRAAGHRVEVDDSGLLGTPLSETVSRTAYRIVQEALTNVRKHAPGAPVEIRLARPGTDRMEITVANPVVPAPALALPSAGVGLVGLRERASLVGGVLRHGVDPDQSYRLRAELPLATPVPA